jgi:bacillithiol synthase
MQHHLIPFSSMPQLAATDVAYATGNPALSPFYKYDVSLENFAAVIADKQNEETPREVLVEVLKTQYQGRLEAPLVQANIEKLLSPTTFTVVTAHQPALFTGPLYYIYKIFSTINLAEQLKAKFPSYDFVPVFVSGGEDHDFAEINHANLFGKTLRWEDETAGGSVGAMSTAGLSAVLEELKTVLGENGASLYQTIHEAYTQNEGYGIASIDLVHRLFHQYGLVALNMAEPAFKRLFIPIMREELWGQVSQGFIEQTQAELNDVGFSSQAHAREINLFYLQAGRRDRIIREGEGFQVLNTDLYFSDIMMEEELEANPQFFSPNVVLRPLFQELILPNLAYVGGGGEIAYWLERKSQFEHFSINFPMLMRRNSVLWLDKATCQKMDKLGLTVEDLLQDTDLVIRQYVGKNAESELNLVEEMADLKTLFEKIRQKSLQVDPTLEKAILAEGVKQEKVIEQLEGRLMRAEKQKHETSLNQIRGLRDKLFPNNGLQERTDNFLPYQLKYGESFFAELKKGLNPFLQGMIVLEDR